MHRQSLTSILRPVSFRNRSSDILSATLTRPRLISSSACRWQMEQLVATVTKTANKTQTRQIQRYRQLGKDNGRHHTDHITQQVVLCTETTNYRICSSAGWAYHTRWSKLHLHAKFRCQAFCGFWAIVWRKPASSSTHLHTPNQILSRIENRNFCWGKPNHTEWVSV